MYLVSDANILIDIEVGNLLPAMFRLPQKFVVPNILYHEELQDNHPELPALGLQIETLEPELIIETMRLTGIYKHPSTNDLMALTLAKNRGWALLTGDSNLRLACNSENVVVHGTLWLIEEISQNRAANEAEIRAAYDYMRNGNRRLPWTEVEAQLNRLYPT